MKAILYRILLIALLFLFLILLPHFPSKKLIYIYLRIPILIFILLESIQVFHDLFLKNEIRSLWKNIGLIFFSVYIMFLILEGIFSFVARSHGDGSSLASRLWFSKYWEPVNHLGFRDVEPQISDSMILFVGDSFTAGHGINKIEDRFSDQVKQYILKNKISNSVVNIGMCGYDTDQEYDVMTKFIDQHKKKTKTIVLLYFGNDISETTKKQNLFFNVALNPLSDLNIVTQALIQGSFFINYIYYLSPPIHNNYILFLKDAYNNESLFSKHLEELQKFVDYSQKNNIQLIAVIFPFLQDLKLSESLYTHKIKTFFESQNIDCIDVASLAVKIPTTKRLVNKNDAHASVEVNHLVAQEIIKKIKF